MTCTNMANYHFYGEVFLPSYHAKASFKDLRNVIPTYLSPN
ncbi:hypothetical protein SAMN05421807_11674 [Virgibacillus chiguensis]|uniref:Uncharacterized protein n=1 Tax=Virgibacillus chiguensis TaxID=411959 RepID=A0A1M5WIE2_9BACI|nr:hypothetical protein SAMN05421807_11674 [Virgibacillus chiguensis]